MGTQQINPHNVQLAGQPSGIGTGVCCEGQVICRRLAGNLNWYWRWIAITIVVSLSLLFGSAWLERSAGMPRGDELLLMGIKTENANWVDSALAAGASVNARDERGCTPLMWAAQDSDESLVRRLIACGADVTAVSAFGETALSIVAGHDHLTVMRVLLDAGAQVVNPRSAAAPRCITRRRS